MILLHMHLLIIQVGDNGVISFGKPFLFYQPQQFPTINANIRNSFVVAPFWADVDNRKSGKITVSSL